MATPIWGQLDKGQTDDEKIEEAIDRLIEAHNDDADSHLGEDQALQSHKAAEIIDHIAGSVVADKFSHQDFYYLYNFETIESWEKSAEVYLSDWPGVVVSAFEPTYLVSYLYSVLAMRDLFLDYTKTLVFQSVVVVDQYLDSVFICGIGDWSAGTPLTPDFGFGFQLLNGVLKGWCDNGSTILYTDAIDYDETIEHIFRAQWDPDTEKFSFYIDGVVVGTISTSTHDEDMEGAVFYVCQSVVEDGECWCSIRNLLLSRSI